MSADTEFGTLDSVLESFRELARNNHDLGDLFERLIANYLVTDPQYAALFSDVWLWSEWPDSWGPDTGIDLVAREAASGDYWAIQCKFYMPEHQLRQADIDSFLAASGHTFRTNDGTHTFTNRLIVSTTDRWGPNAESALADQQIPVERLSLSDLENSPIDWSQFDLRRPDRMRLQAKNELRPHQQTALDAVAEGYTEHDRGKLIMACGTGKTFVSLRIAEHLVPAGGRILFLAPSISLVGQSLREWTANAENPFHALAVCSDTQVGNNNEDTRAYDIPYPATTDPSRLVQAAEALEASDENRRTVVFSTYQSIQVVSDAQAQGLGEFDLIICDEAHRTTGLTREGESDSDFVKVHDNRHVVGHKRLYMTATPRIFTDASRERAAERNAVLYSMDDETRFGPTFHRLGFGEAVQRGLLCDYRVLLMAVDESKMAHLLNAYSAELGDDNQPPSAVDSRFVAKIFGSWKGLAKKDVRLIGEDGEYEAPAYDRQPMRRAIAFSKSINNSKTLSKTFPRLINMYRNETGQTDTLGCAFEHVDGTMNALVRQQKLDWLKGDDDTACRILSNARCLSEGIDVPALDGVIFFDTRESVVDIVQSVGRVMRKPVDNPHNKQYGYIVLPVGIPSASLENYDRYISSDPQFKGIWKVIKALRAHDESLVDEAEFRKKIQVIDSEENESRENSDRDNPFQFDLDLPPLPIGDISEAVYAAIPRKLGDTAYWQDWAQDVARIAQNVIGRINALLEQSAPRAAFDNFLTSLHQNINPAVTEANAVEMLAQHMVTRPVFDALFPQRTMQDSNPVSHAMEDVITHMDRHGVESEMGDLTGFYDSIRERAALAKSEKSRQELIRSLYDSFFATAFERTARQLGIVYTPTEIVDFILHSANDALADHFGRRLTDTDVHLLDPFSGTGTFLTRLLQDPELIADGDLDRKYRQEMHANEIVLLAYYVATVNIESAFRARLDADNTANEATDTAFPGMVLTDTFQMSEPRDWVDESILANNSERIQRQQDTPIKVIVGNPPYSASQGNTGYDYLDNRIHETYVAHSQAQLVNSLYDSYIRAIRWASDRVEDQGIVAFVTNAGWLDGNSSAGIRKCLRDEFSAVYVFDLRGNANTQGDLRQREAGSVFGGGTRTPIAITLLVKSSEHTGPASIHYHDIGDYLSTREKLDRIAAFESYRGMNWQTIEPNTHHDWINQRREDFYTFTPLYGGDRAIFSIRSGGIKSNRDPWVYNLSPHRLAANVQRHIAFYEAEVERLAPALAEYRFRPEQVAYVKSHRRLDNTCCNWADPLPTFAAQRYIEPFDTQQVVLAIYRPFYKSWLYFSKLLNNRRYRMPDIFPTSAHPNRVIQVTGMGSHHPFSCLMSDVIPDVQLISNGQCLPLYYYEPFDATTHRDLLDQVEVHDGYVRRDAITDTALTDFRSHYDDAGITKEDIFYYIYGVLHSPVYRQRYGVNLKLAIPRIPYAPDFHTIKDAGKALAELHVGYESVDPYPLREQSDALALEPDENYRVQTMRWGGTSQNSDKSRIVVNEHLTLSDIPDEAHEYQVNGKTALGWILDRYQMTCDQHSGIVNDPNEFSDDPRYIVDLIKKVTRVSVETVRIVRNLPNLDAETVDPQESSGAMVSADQD